jgi:integrative and conjugative element protein (TIGR02256 family)
MPIRLDDRLRFQRPDGTVLLINAVALGIMRGFRQTRRRDAEAGGILLGRHLLGVPHVVVDEVTMPSKDDARRFTFFRRSHATHQQIIDARWAASGGTCQYLGEWHTHPEPVPHASSVDMADWRRRLREDVFDGDSLLFVIVGTDAIRVWEGARANKLLTPLDQT